MTGLISLQFKGLSRFLSSEYLCIIITIISTTNRWSLYYLWVRWILAWILCISETQFSHLWNRACRTSQDSLGNEWDVACESSLCTASSKLCGLPCPPWSCCSSILCEEHPRCGSSPMAQRRVNWGSSISSIGCWCQLLWISLRSFLVNFQVTLKEKLLFSMPPAECSHHKGNVPTLCPPGRVVKVNELVFVKCFEIRGWKALWSQKRLDDY